MKFLKIKFTILLFLSILFLKLNAQDNPNIECIIVNDFGFNYVEIYYQNKRISETNLPVASILKPDIIAEQGDMLDHYYCTVPVGTSTMAPFLTGLSQEHANVRHNQFDKALAENHKVAKVFKTEDTRRLRCSNGD